MSGAGDSLRPAQAPRQPVDLLGRRVRFRATVGRVAEVDVLSAAQVVILTRDGMLLRVPATDWDEIELLP